MLGRLPDARTCQPGTVLSFPAVLGTVAIERIADILVLGLGLIITALFLRGRLQSVFELVAWPQIAVGFGLASAA